MQCVINVLGCTAEDWLSARQSHNRALLSLCLVCVSWVEVCVSWAEVWQVALAAMSLQVLMEQRLGLQIVAVLQHHSKASYCDINVLRAMKHRFATHQARR